VVVEPVREDGTSDHTQGALQMTITIEDFKQTVVGERCFFADGGLGIKTYDYDHGQHGTDRVREDAEVTRARIRFVPALAEAKERYDAARAEAYRLDREASDIARAAWDRYHAVAEGARAAMVEAEAAYDSANAALQAALLAASEDLATWQRRYEVSQGHGLRAWWARRWCMATEPGGLTRGAVADAEAAERSAWEQRAAVSVRNKRDMEVAEGRYLDASVRNEAQTRAAGNVSRAEQALARAYEAALDPTSAVTYA
jgi:hypothetical protein